jgi:excisionase family DNA binding protein
MEYLTVQEAAHRLRVAPVTIRRYIAQGGCRR